MVFSALFNRKARISEAVVIAAYEAIVAAARQPVIFSHWHVADTPLGRFESLSLHMILFLRRTKDASPQLREMGQFVVEEFFKDVDHSLRELGIGDASMAKRVKRLARMFYGRAAAYDTAVNSGDADQMAAALTRNMSPDDAGWRGALPLARHALACASALADQSDEALLQGIIAFATPAATGVEK